MANTEKKTLNTFDTKSSTENLQQEHDNSKFPKDSESPEDPESSENLEEEYQFFRLLVKRNIFKLTSVKEQLVISTWLHSCDTTEDKSTKCGFVKLLLVSLQHISGNLHYFNLTSPSILPHVTNTLDSLQYLLTLSLIEEKEKDYFASNVDTDIKYKTIASAAVSSNLTSFASTFVDRNCVQVFYARSDHAINSWRLPEHVLFPRDSRSPSRWESAISRKDIRTAIPKVNPDSFLNDFQFKSEESWERIHKASDSQLSPSERQCRHILRSDQVTAVVVNPQNIFKWYEHSRLDGSLRPTYEICVDKHTCQFEKNQLEMDERAINVVNKVFPGHVRMVLDPVLIADVTGIKVNRTVDGDCLNLNTHDKTLMIGKMIDCKVQ
ncbi:Hypothetical protein CINCED_3A004511 [Cinara cedri]|uniref:Uncharacterized protein n=1 Tax=Cinara cedri TaxID=506608 RepID=A0A5E4M150_9HEMI|nr:Hypothetical protein CINCED_3A004511 [Cinara cedri]